jgi:single-strand DNA-binding protein
MNSVQVLGNLTRDPVIRATKSGRPVASFSVAVNRSYTTPQGERRELTDFINVVAWGGLAEQVGNQLKKGSRVFVEGRYSTRSYEGNDGQRRYVTEVVANLIALPLSNYSSSGSSMSQAGGFGGQNNFGGQGGFDAGQGSDQTRGNFDQFGTSRKDDEIPF